MLRASPLSNTLGFSRHLISYTLRWPKEYQYGIHAVHVSTKREVDFYAVLGVSHTASVTEIKAAFRKRAKESHPDALKDCKPLQHTFSELLAAYQVLTNARERQLYDLSRDPRTGKALRDAISDPHTERDVEEQWVQGGGWAAWAASAPEPPRAGSEVDHIRAELRTELRSALRHAYLGPKVDVGPGQLPECFEGEERTDPGIGDLLHLVSGRQLLGVVRELKSNLISGDAALLNVPSSSPRPKLENFRADHPSGPAQATEQINGLPSDEAKEAHTSSRPATAPIKEIRGQLQEVRRDAHASSRSAQQQELRQALGSTLAKRTHDEWHAAHVPCQAVRNEPEPVERCVLALEVGDAIVAHGVRERYGHGRAAQSVICVYDADGRLLSREQDGKLEKGSPAADGSSAQIANGYGGAEQSQYAVHRGQTPLVRHIHFVGIQGGQHVSIVSICRCRRAWLPHRSVWIFPPRSLEHSIGGWYFEWPGHNADTHPLWLPPSVFVLTAAFMTLDVEHGRMPEKQESALRRAALWAKNKLQLRAE